MPCAFSHCIGVAAGRGRLICLHSAYYEVGRMALAPEKRANPQTRDAVGSPPEHPEEAESLGYQRGTDSISCATCLLCVDPSSEMSFLGT